MDYSDTLSERNGVPIRKCLQLTVILMSERPHISIYPDNEAQKQRIESQARKHGESMSEYCLRVIEQQIAREAEAERLDDIELDSQLDELKAAITADIAAATEISTKQEDCYELALWGLCGRDYSQEERRQAMQGAPDKLEEDLEKVRDKNGGGE